MATFQIFSHAQKLVAMRWFLSFHTHTVRTTEDDDQTGDSGMGTGSDDPWDVRSFLFRRNSNDFDNAD